MSPWNFIDLPGSIFRQNVLNICCEYSKICVSFYTYYGKKFIKFDVDGTSTWTLNVVLKHIHTFVRRIDWPTKVHTAPPAFCFPVKHPAFQDEVQLAEEKAIKTNLMAFSSANWASSWNGFDKQNKFMVFDLKTYYVNGMCLDCMVWSLLSPFRIGVEICNYYWQ